MIMLHRVMISLPDTGLLLLLFTHTIPLQDTTRVDDCTFFLECWCMTEIVSGKIYGTGRLPVLAKVWTLNSSLWLALSMRMTTPRSDQAVGLTEASSCLRASRTTETVTDRQTVFWIVRQKWAPFLDQNSTKWIFFPQGHMLLSLCSFSWFRPSKHSHGNGNIDY